MITSKFKGYFYPSALIVIVSLGSIYGASIKAEDQLNAIQKKVQDPVSRLEELQAYREQLIAQRIVHARRLANWEQRKLDESEDAA